MVLQELDTPGVDEVFRDFSAALPGCPQAVLQGTLAKLDRMLLHLRRSCAAQSLAGVCRANTPFMFDMFLYYVVLKYGLLELYAVESGGANLSEASAFRGWPITKVEQRVWFSFGALWRVIWPERDFCSCVEGYDYYTTLHALFDLSLHITRPDFPDRVLRSTSEVHRMVRAADHCDEWLDQDFLRIFSSYAKLSACLPGAVMENIVCMQRWLLDGKVMGALNTAEMMVKLLTMSDTCMDDTRWPFTKEDVLHNFARLALRWPEVDEGCGALNRFGHRISPGPCPVGVDQRAYRGLLWTPSRLQQQGRFGACTMDFARACVVDGTVTVAEHPQVPFLETCSETGGNRHAFRVEAELLEAEAGRPAVGFVLNLPERSTNIWHNVHWLVPAVARLHGDPRLRRRVPGEVLLLLLYQGYTFQEGKLEYAPPPAEDLAALAEQARELEAWTVQYAPLLRLLTAAPPVLFRGVRRRCFEPLLWGHANMRADRELAQPGAVGPAEVDVFRGALGAARGADLEALAAGFWGRAAAAEGPPAVLLVQRDLKDLRAFEDLAGLAAAGLAPLQARGEATWRAVDDLGRQPLLFQAGVFRSADVLIGAVGAPLAWMVVMRPGSQVLEWLPEGVPPTLYRCSEAWNADALGMFGGLGRLARVDHVCLRSEATPPEVRRTTRIGSFETGVNANGGQPG
ncbi:unnamed protein product, partial [Prorocentrum cordatum]